MFHFRETYQSEEQTQFLLDAIDVTTFFELKLTGVCVVEQFVSWAAHSWRQQSEILDLKCWPRVGRWEGGV